MHLLGLILRRRSRKNPGGRSLPGPGIHSIRPPMDSCMTSACYCPCNSEDVPFEYSGVR